VVREHADAIVTIGDSSYILSKEFAEIAIRQRLPLMVGNRLFMSGGALMSYGADFADIYRKAATYVAKILNGAAPADLPMEQPTRVELIINLKTAKAIGLAIPQSLLRAPTRCSSDLMHLRARWTLRAEWPLCYSAMGGYGSRWNGHRPPAAMNGCAAGSDRCG
jgi:hypothetical protein